MDQMTSGLRIKINSILKMICGTSSVKYEDLTKPLRMMFQRLLSEFDCTQEWTFIVFEDTIFNPLGMNKQNFI